MSLSTAQLVRAARETLLEALHELPDSINVVSEPGKITNTPAALLGPPLLRWESTLSQATSARFPVIVVESRDEETLDRLMELVPQVAELLDGLPEACVIDAAPTTRTSADLDLPAYTITVEVGLS